MNQQRGYMFIDGTFLLQEVTRLRRSHPEYNNRRLIVQELVGSLKTKWGSNIQALVSVNFYFKKQDSRLQDLLVVPTASTPGGRDHWRLIECGQPVNTIPEDQLNLLDNRYRDCFARGEKGLDTRLICDALALVAQGYCGEVVLVTNDRDFIPFMEVVQRLGANMYLCSLHSSFPIQEEIAKNADKYMTLDNFIEQMFESASNTGEADSSNDAEG